MIQLVENKGDFIQISFTKSWAQEDITQMVDHVLLSVSQIQIQEKNIGADREDVRFSWQGSYFILNFDCYSQSCWIEGQDSASTENLTSLLDELIQ